MFPPLCSVPQGAPGPAAARRVANFWVATCHTSKIFHSLSAAADARAIKYSFGAFLGGDATFKGVREGAVLGHALPFMSWDRGLTLQPGAGTPYKKCNFQTEEEQKNICIDVGGGRQGLGAGK